MLARRMERVSSSPIMELIKTTASGDYLSFASGLPDPALFPAHTLRGIADDVLTRDGSAALQYGAAEGYTPLRDLVAQTLRARGLAAAVENVLITSGSQQGLDLAARALLDPGDPVAVESPTYLAARQVFDSCEARYLSVPVDEEGLVPASLRAVIKDRPRLLYTLPTFQNPTGITLPLDRRREVAEAAERAGVVLVEDDAYHDLRYDGDPLPPVSALGSGRLVSFYTGTFSKTIAPGVRVGYVAGPAELIARLTQLKQITDLHSGSLSQRIVYEYCVRGHLEPGIQRFRAAYRARRDVMLRALEEHVSGVLRWTRPAGGMFVFATLPEGCDAAELLERALERRVVFVPGAGFHPDGRGANTLRLNFVSAGEGRIREGIGILAGVIREWIP